MLPIPFSFEDCQSWHFLTSDFNFVVVSNGSKSTSKCKMNAGSASISACQHWRFLHLPLDIRKCNNSRLPIFSRASSLIISKLEEQHVLPIRNKEKPIEIF
jgi:hypothetical protein